MLLQPPQPIGFEGNGIENRRAVLLFRTPADANAAFNSLAGSSGTDSNGRSSKEVPLQGDSARSVKVGGRLEARSARSMCPQGSLRQSICCAWSRAHRALKCEHALQQLASALLQKGQAPVVMKLAPVPAWSGDRAPCDGLGSAVPQSTNNQDMHAHTHTHTHTHARTHACIPLHGVVGVCLQVRRMAAHNGLLFQVPKQARRPRPQQVAAAELLLGGANGQPPTRRDKYRQRELLQKKGKTPQELLAAHAKYMRVRRRCQCAPPPAFSCSLGCSTCLWLVCARPRATACQLQHSPRLSALGGMRCCKCGHKPTYGDCV